MERELWRQLTRASRHVESVSGSAVDAGEAFECATVDDEGEFGAEEDEGGEGGCGGVDEVELCVRVYELTILNEGVRYRTVWRFFNVGIWDLHATWELINGGVFLFFWSVRLFEGR